VRSPGRGGGTGVLYMATGCRRPEELLLPALLYDLLLQQRDLCLLLLCLLLALPYLLDLCARTPSTSAEPSGRIRNPMCALAALLGRTCLKPPVCQLFLFRKPSPPPMANDDARLESEPDSGRTLSRRHTTVTASCDSLTYCSLTRPLRCWLRARRSARQHGRRYEAGAEPHQGDVHRTPPHRPGEPPDMPFHNHPNHTLDLHCQGLLCPTLGAGRLLLRGKYAVHVCRVCSEPPLPGASRAP
jgi:hypothetical protein